MSNFIDLTGLKFGKLTAKYKIRKDKHKSWYWFCECECGGTKEARGDNLRKELTAHCGCVNNFGTHKKTGHRIHNIWLSMKDRCYNKNSKDYCNYGERGISICDEWLNDFMSFYNWAYDNKYDDNLTIDRIDVNGNYEPSNCRWATPEEQSNNTRINNLIEINGEVKSLSQWARISGVTRQTIQRRYDKGIRGDDLLSPVVIVKAEYQSGVPYIKWDKKKRRWRTELKLNDKKYFIGYFKDLEIAIKKQSDHKNKLIKQKEEEVDIE